MAVTPSMSDRTTFLTSATLLTMVGRQCCNKLILWGVSTLSEVLLNGVVVLPYLQKGKACMVMYCNRKVTCDNWPTEGSNRPQLEKPNQLKCMQVNQLRHPVTQSTCSMAMTIYS